MVWIIVLVILVLLVLFVINTYNSLVVLRTRVEEAFATMDVYLKKRFDLIPNLVSTVKGYAKYESSTLEKVMKMRTQGYSGMSTAEKVDTENKISQEIGKLLAVAEAYPDLKANQNFLDLTSQLTQIEGEIAESRKYYNACVRVYNTKVQMFPSNIVASIFKFTTEKMFEAAAEERQNVKVNFDDISE